MKTFWTSDTHFGHEKIIEYCNRPFANASEMNEALVRKWNSVIGPDDEVWHIGDVFFRDGFECLYRLNGKIHLIYGNHDEQIKNAAASVFPSDSQRVLKARFTSIQDYKEIKINGQNIVMFHYGLRTWHHDLRGTWMLYGHSHNELPAYGKSVDVGVDNPLWNFSPVSFEQLKTFMDAQPIGGHPQFDKFNKPPQF